jgi:hypothetical protein
MERGRLRAPVREAGTRVADPAATRSRHERTCVCPRPFHPTAGAAAPGDEAPPGAPGGGEQVFPDCGDSGRRDGQACPTCCGSGKINAGIGGG